MWGEVFFTHSTPCFTILTYLVILFASREVSSSQSTLLNRPGRVLGEDPQSPIESKHRRLRLRVDVPETLLHHDLGTDPVPKIWDECIVSVDS